MSYADAIVAELAAHGAEDIGVDWGHPHPRVVFTWQGVRRFYVTPASPSDRRGIHNALSDIRRMLGVKRVVRKSTAVRTRKRRRERPVGMPETFTVAPDPWLVLRRMGM